MSKKKVIILGGGMGALSAAWYLTDKTNWKDEYDITLYQLGWRLGGKGASSRNMDRHCRSEEHGLHIWAGWYANAFGMLGACYQELGLDIQAAFRPQDHVCLLDTSEGRSEPWSIRLDDFPDQFPGVDHPEPSAWRIFKRLLRIIARRLEDAVREASASRPEGAPPLWIRTDEAGHYFTSSLGGGDPLQRALDLVAQTSEMALLGNRQLLDPLLPLLRSFRADVTQWLIGDRLSRARKALDLMCSIAIGIVADGVLRNGVNTINRREFRQWLRDHGASDDTVRWAPVQLLYDSPFAYPGGDTSNGDLAAGVALGTVLRLGLAYRGHAFYDMAGGMGDVVITPLYMALVERGVKFEFFQRVEGLDVDGPAKQRTIRRIRFRKQATVTGASYQPLIFPEKLGRKPCWPSAPLYEQLNEGVELRDGGFDLESCWTTWRAPDDEWHIDLDPQRDHVILGVSLGALDTICAGLAAVDGKWKRLIEGLPTVQTQSVQLWLNRQLRGSGWLPPGGWIVTAPQPMSVAADMTHVKECWQTPPASVHYLCGPLAGDFQHLAPNDPPARAIAQVLAEAARWLDDDASKVWSNCTNASGRFDWSMLLDAGNAQGPERLKSQYVRANINPSDRYVLSPSATPRLRLPSEKSGFTNLVLAGDWTRTALNIGCVEAAVMSGMAAARALRGDRRPRINGERFLT